MLQDYLCMGIEREKYRYYDAGCDSVIAIDHNPEG